MRKREIREEENILKRREREREKDREIEREIVER